MLKYTEFEDETYGSEKELRSAYHKVVGELESERDEIEAEYRGFQKRREEYEELFVRMHYFYKGIGEHLVERKFTEMMDSQADEFFLYRRRAEQEMDEQEEEYKKKKKTIYQKEEDIQEIYNRKLQLFE